MFRRIGIVALAALAGTFAGCDDRDQKSRAKVEEAETKSKTDNPANRLPTTRELMSEPRRKLPLADFPLSIEAPRDWRLESIGDASLLQVVGQASSGLIMIQLTKNPTELDAAKIDAALKMAQKELAEKPHPVNRAELRSLGPCKVLEQRMISNPLIGGKLEPERWTEETIEDRSTGRKLSVPIIANPHLLKWSITVYVPSADPSKYTPRTLIFLAVKLSQYEQDREFLESLVQSLKYEPN